MVDVRKLVKVKPLEWERRDNVWAQCPLTKKQFSIWPEDGLWWASWDLSLPGAPRLEDVQQWAEDWRNEHILAALTPEASHD